MNKIFIIFVVLGLSFNSFSGPKEGSHLTKSNPRQFGEELKKDSINTLEVVVSNFADYEGKTVTFEAKAKKVCKKSGCWMVLKDGEHEVRTLFKDYGFFVPADILGKKVRVQGVMEQKKVSAATIRHYLKDEGKKMQEIKKVKSGQTQFQFVATGVELVI